MQIVFRNDGSIEFTRSPLLLKATEGLGDLRIKRMTDIQFDEDTQRFYIKFITGPHKGTLISLLTEGYELFAHDYGGWPVDFHVHTERFGLITFATYEEAVEAEIRFVEFLRDLGISME